jgi:hypothetical protein
MSPKSNRPQNNPHPDPHKKPSEKESTNRHVYIEPGAQIDFVQDLRKKYETAQTDNKTHNDRQLLWTKIAAGLLFITACFTGWQGCLTRQIITNSAEQFRQDQRAWLGTKGMILHVKAGDPIYGESGIVNAGKTPAFDVGIDYTLKFTDTAVDIEEYANSRGKQQFTTAPSTAVLLPGAYFPLKASTEKAIASPDFPDLLLQHKTFIYMFGEITYTDVFKRRHISRFCGDWDQSHGVFAACKGTYESAD